MEITFELESGDIDVEFECDFVRENFCDHSQTKWVFSSPSQGTMDGLLNANKRDLLKYSTTFLGIGL